MHRSGGLTAHYQAGARTSRMNLIIGVPFLVCGLLFGPSVLAMLGLIPLAVLAGLLAFTGVTHAWLASDLRDFPLITALAVGISGFLAANLAVGLVVGLVMHWGARALRSEVAR